MQSIYAQSGVAGLWRGAASLPCTGHNNDAVQVRRDRWRGSVSAALFSCPRTHRYTHQKPFDSTDAAQCKQFVEARLGLSGVAVYLSSSMLAGFLVACAMSPFDVISVRWHCTACGPIDRGSLYNQPAPVPGAAPFYRGWTDCGAGAHLPGPSHAAQCSRPSAPRAWQASTRRERAQAAPTPDAAQGFWPVYFRIGPHTILTFMLWEQLIRLEERWQDDRR